MWNGRLAREPRRRPRALPQRGLPRGRRRRSSRACARSRAPAAPSRYGPRSRRRRRAAEVADAAHHLDAERDGAILPSSRSRSVPSCSTTDAMASSRSRPRRKPGWKTTTSAPHAAAMPALRSSAPTADENLRPLASRCPMKPKRGACTDSAMSAVRRRRPASRPTNSPSRSRPRSRSRRRRSRVRGGARRHGPDCRGRECRGGRCAFGPYTEKLPVRHPSRTDERPRVSPASPLFRLVGQPLVTRACGTRRRS